ncbi:hypothetical protein GCK32_020561, partial [Trichostrongylus colubriformis]
MSSMDSFTAYLDEVTPVFLGQRMLNSQAAVAFDGSSMKFIVISDKNLLEGLEIGETFDQDGKNLTVLQLCPTVEEAEAACDQRASQLSSTKA